MTPQEQKVMEQALEAYIKAGAGNSTDFVLQRKAYHLAVEALAQQPQDVVRGLLSNEQVDEPVGVVAKDGRTILFFDNEFQRIEPFTEVYTHPPVPTAQPEQEPVARTVWVVGNKVFQQICATSEDAHKLIADLGMNTPSLYPSVTEVPLLSYTTPPQHSAIARKPLTDKEILSIARDHYNPHQRAEISFARAIEAAHGIKGDA